MSNPFVILVDQDDKEIGQKEKLAAHLDGDLHRAFSVFIFNSKGQLLIQKRAAEKYHSPNLWTNSCCSHQSSHIPDEEFIVQRLEEEIGIRTPLTFLFKFIYKSDYENGLTEHEYDHVYYGITDDLPLLNPEEASSFEYVEMETLMENISEAPEKYTSWFKIILNQYKEQFNAIEVLSLW